MKIGFIALGRMGSAMARRLLDAGHDLAVFNRDRAKTAPFAADGATVAADLAEVCRDRELVITMLASDAALNDVVLGAGGLAQTMPTETIHMCCGTHAVATIQSVEAAHREAGQVLVAAPVLGRPDLAASGELSVVPAGPASAVDFIRPALEDLGRRIFPAGEDPSSSTAIKLANNFVLGCAIEAMGEGMALVRKHGVEASLLHEVLTEGLFASVAYKVYGDIIAREDWDSVGASALIGLKDANLALQAAEASGVPLPSLNVWRDRLVAACQKGDAERDWSVMAREQFRASGLE